MTDGTRHLRVCEHLISLLKNCYRDGWLLCVAHSSACPGAAHECLCVVRCFGRGTGDFRHLLLRHALCLPAPWIGHVQDGSMRNPDTI